MTIEELKFFLKYLLKLYINDIKNISKGLNAIARPKIWFFIFSIILIWQVGFVKNRFNIIIVLLVILFIWAWDIYEQGHWKGEMRKEIYEKIKQKK